MRRGFEKVSGYEYVNLPQRKTKQSAGYDIESAVDDVITPGETKLIPTGLKAYMCENEWMGIYIRSSIAVKHGIVKETESHKEYFIDITRWMATALMVIGPAV